MLAVTNFNPSMDMVRVFDTLDNTNEITKLSMLVPRIFSGELFIAGLGLMGTTASADAYNIPMYNIYISIYEAKVALINYYVSQGYSYEQARSFVG